MMLVVKPRHGLSQWLDTSRGTILASMACNVDLLRPLEAAFDLIINLRGTLTQVGPALGILEISMFVCALRGPYDTGGGTGRVETGVRLVAFVGTELTVDLGGELWRVLLVRRFQSRPDASCDCDRGFGVGDGAEQ